MSNTDREQLGELLSAYIDGEVNDRQRTMIERLVREDNDAKALLNELRRTAESVSSLPRHSAPDSISQYLGDQLERNELLGTAPDPRPRTRQRGFPAAAFMAAAMLGIVLIGGIWFIRNGTRNDPRIRENLLVQAEPRDDAMAEKVMKRSLEAPSTARSTLANRKKESRAEVQDRDQATSPGLIAGGSSKPARPLGGNKAHGGRRTRNVEANRTSRPVDTAVNTMTDRVTVAEKLASGHAPADLRTHSFDLEPLRLKIAVRDDGQRRAAIDGVTAFLSVHGAVDIAQLPPEKNTERLGRTGFFLRGRAHVNFGEGMSEQLLVGVASDELDALMGELGQAVPSDDDVSLFAGPLVFRGLGNTRATLRRLEPSKWEDRPRSNETAIERSSGPSESKEPDSDLTTPTSTGTWNREGSDERRLKDLLTAIGLDAGLVDELTSVTPAPRSSPVDDRADSAKQKPHEQKAAGESHGEDTPSSARAAGNGRASLVQRRLRSLSPPDGSMTPQSATKEEPPIVATDSTRDEQSGRGVETRFVALVLEFVVDGAQPNTPSGNRRVREMPKPPKNEADKSPSMN